MTRPLPCPVWVVISPGSQYATTRYPGLLLEWRQVPDPRGAPAWEGLVLWARHGASSVRWSASVEWLRAHHLQPMSS